MTIKRILYLFIINGLKILLSYFKRHFQNSQTKIESINNTNYENVDCVVEDINLALCNVANAALGKSCNTPKKNTTKPPKWYD
jgi:hypothetical protein